MDVGLPWEGGVGGSRSRYSSLRGSLGNLVRRRPEMLNVREEEVRAHGLSEPSGQYDIVYACRYARGTRVLDVERRVLVDRLSD